MIYIPAIYLPIHNGLIIIFTLAKYHSYAFSLPIVVNRALGDFLDSPVGLGNDIEQNEKVVIIMRLLIIFADIPYNLKFKDA